MALKQTYRSTRSSESFESLEPMFGCAKDKMLLRKHPQRCSSSENLSDRFIILILTGVQ